jgi:CBS domain-containing protein
VSTVSEILERKGSDVLTIDAAATVLEAIEKMVGSNVGALLVTVDGHLRGIVTERDYLRRVALEGRTESETQVSEIMTAPLVYVTPESTIEDCMAVMTERRIRHLPVLDDHRQLAGIVSIGDVVKFQSARQDVQIRLLTDYIGLR